MIHQRTTILEWTFLYRLQLDFLIFFSLKIYRSTLWLILIIFVYNILDNFFRITILYSLSRIITAYFLPLLKNFRTEQLTYLLQNKTAKLVFEKLL